MGETWTTQGDLVNPGHGYHPSILVRGVAQDWTIEACLITLTAMGVTFAKARLRSRGESRDARADADAPHAGRLRTVTRPRHARPLV